MINIQDVYDSIDFYGICNHLNYNPTTEQLHECLSLYIMANIALPDGYTMHGVRFNDYGVWFHAFGNTISNSHMMYIDGKWQYITTQQYTVFGHMEPHSKNLMLQYIKENFTDPV